MNLQEVEAAGRFAFLPRKNLVYVPGEGVLVVWVDEEHRGEMCAVVRPNTRRLPDWARRDGWEHVGFCDCEWCVHPSEWE